MFIEVTDSNDDLSKLLLNKNHIISVWKSSTTTGIKTIDGDYYVIERYEEVKEILNK